MREDEREPSLTTDTPTYKGGGGREVVKRKDNKIQKLS